MSEMERPASEPRTSVDPGPPLPFERWAELSARLLKRSRDERLDILEEHEVDPLEWDRSERHWVAQLADDLDRGDEDRADRYAARCAEEMRRREGKPDETVPAEPAITAPPVAPPPLEPPRVAPPPLEPPLVAPPPLVTPPPSAPPPIVSKPVIDSTMQPLVMPIPGRVLPFGDKPSLDLSKPSPPQPLPSTVGETLPFQMDLMAIAMPFIKRAEGGSAPAHEERAPSPAPLASTPAPANVGPPMTLDAYASLCAELLAYPERRPDIRKRYRIPDEATLAAVHARWQAHFGEQPQVRAEWQAKCTAFRDWLTKNR